MRNAARKKMPGTWKRHRAAPRPIHPLRKDCWDAVWLADSGVYDKAIARITGLTLGQVRARLQMFGHDRQKYRNGEGPMFDRMRTSESVKRQARRRQVTVAREWIKAKAAAQ